MLHDKKSAEISLKTFGCYFSQNLKQYFIKTKRYPVTTFIRKHN